MLDAPPFPVPVSLTSVVVLGDVAGGGEVEAVVVGALWRVLVGGAVVAAVEDVVGAAVGVIVGIAVGLGVGPWVVGPGSVMKDMLSGKV